MKGLAIDVVQAIIIMVFVLLLVTFLFSGVWKDVISKFGKDIGIQEPTKLEGVTSTADRTDISCIAIPIGSGNGYRYQVGIQGMKIRIETPRDIVPILLFKDKAVLSYNSQGSPLYISKDSMENDVGSNLLYTIETVSPPVTNEFLTIAVFEKNDKCIDVARTGSAENTFAACARFLIGLTKLTVSSAPSCTGLEPLGSISDISGGVMDDSSCTLDYKMTNIGSINWMLGHRIKSIMRCFIDKYIPVDTDSYITGSPSYSVRAADLAFPIGSRQCSFWDVARQQLEGRPEWERFRNGWKIELYYDCDNNNCDPSKKMAEVSFKEQCSRCLKFDTYESCIVNNNCYQSSQQCEICPANPTCSLFSADPRQCTNRCGLNCVWTETSCEPACGTITSGTTCNARSDCSWGQKYPQSPGAGYECKSCSDIQSCGFWNRFPSSCNSGKCGKRCYIGSSDPNSHCNSCPSDVSGWRCGTLSNPYSCRNPPCGLNLDCYSEKPLVGSEVCKTCPSDQDCSKYNSNEKCSDCNYPQSNCRWSSGSCVNR